MIVKPVEHDGYTEAAPVVYVDRKYAKAAKIELETMNVLHKFLRMVVSKDNDQWIAVPVACEAVDSLQLSVPILGRGIYECPYNKIRWHGANKSHKTSGLTPIQTILVQIQKDHDNLVLDDDVQTLMSKVRTLNLACCPMTLEVVGVDRTLVIPLKAFGMEDLGGALGEFWTKEQAYPLLWKALARANSCSRVIRRGEIDPNSPIRHSQYQILWYDASLERFSEESGQKWITVIEDGIQQSFHLEHVMFSRGNITEKMRFGRKLVQPGEQVLDLYAGIGYFSLQAAVHGRANHVTCCEWNPEAVEALERNIHLNRVHGSVTVIQADCRSLTLDPIYDRVSLGLLPSSEGGWPVAVRSLSKSKGGWLHIHGNVPKAEIDVVWAPWVAWTLKGYVDNDSWSVVVHHVERVKSYAPRVLHCVADVHIGPIVDERYIDQLSTNCAGVVGVVSKDGTFRHVQASNVKVPSCALSTDGVLHQEWMRAL